MPVIVENITKTYGEQIAVDSINFKVDEGEIVGFLGPNGAGKTTTMKILTGFIPQTKGIAKVCNINVTEKPIEVRKTIGYLPENNPLYLDMFVKEYLTFVAKVHKVKNIKKRISEIIELTGLQIEQHKKTGQLSKGYRQRVGLASALIHNPKVLILDEPTTGLDPNQIVEIRQLIKNLGQNKTVIFSTHIMQEVEAVCDRVIIINKGKIVADDSVDALQSKGGRNIYSIEFLQKLNENIFTKLSQLQGVEKLNKKTNGVLECFSSNQTDLRPTIFNFAVNNQLTLIGLNKQENSLEDVFKQLTNNNQNA